MTHRRPSRRLVFVVLAVVLLAVLGRRWLALGWQAARFPTAPVNAHTQAAAAGDFAYLAAGSEGIAVVALPAGTLLGLVASPFAGETVDDLAVADGFLFALDARPPGHLAVLSLADPAAPALVSPPVTVPVGPFSGVAAAARVVVVSGGTSQLTARTYTADGRLEDDVATGDFGRGQPDVTLRDDGHMAAVSTHTFGPDFALTFLAIPREPLRLEPLGQIALPAAGFTEGGAKPAHFPLATAWRGDHLYVADGGGLAVVDVRDPGHPRLLEQFAEARPAVDLALAGDQLDVLTAGPRPAIRRYHVDAAGHPSPAGLLPLPPGSQPAALVATAAGPLLTRYDAPWRLLAASDFSHRP